MDARSTPRPDPAPWIAVALGAGATIALLLGVLATGLFALGDGVRRADVCAEGLGVVTDYQEGAYGADVTWFPTGIRCEYEDAAISTFQLDVPATVAQALIAGWFGVQAAGAVLAFRARAAAASATTSSREAVAAGH